jgi:hypothetical protein
MYKPETFFKTNLYILPLIFLIAISCGSNGKNKKNFAQTQKEKKVNIKINFHCKDPNSFNPKNIEDEKIKKRIIEWQKQLTKINKGKENKVADTIEKIINTLEKINLQNPNNELSDKVRDLSRQVNKNPKNKTIDQAIEFYGKN